MFFVVVGVVGVVVVVVVAAVVAVDSFATALAPVSQALFLRPTQQQQRKRLRMV